MKELFNDPKEDEYLSEFRQKIAQEMQEDIEQRRRELERSRNGFIGTIGGIILAGLVSWFLLLPKFGFQNQEDIPIIRRPITAVKIRPIEPGGMDIQNKDKTVYSLVEKKEGETKVESLLPPPETPKMPTIVAAAEEKTVPTENFKENMSEEMDELIAAVETSATEKINIPQKLPIIEVKVQKASEDQPSDQPVVEEKQVKEQKQEQKTQGKYKIQLIASQNKNSVEKAYTTLSEKYPVLKGLLYSIEKGQDDLYRLKVGAFSNKKEAEDVCAKIKNAGGSCMVKE